MARDPVAGLGEAPSRVLVTGGAGFIGSNLSDRLLGLGHRVTVYDALSRPGVSRNLDWLKARHGDAVAAVVADVRDGEALARAASDADAVFHLAAQVAVDDIHGRAPGGFSRSTCGRR